METPAAWLVENIATIPRGGRVLDVASGRGRHARWLAAQGFDVHAVDRDAAALASLAQNERATPHGNITTEVVDLEQATPALGHRCYAAVVVFNYLHRPLMPVIVDAVAPGGVLIYETFTVGQAARGHPRNPAFLLGNGELPGLVTPLEVVRFREGEVDGQLKASIVAVRR